MRFFSFGFWVYYCIFIGMRHLRFITAIDGGGIRGILPLKILEYINERLAVFEGNHTLHSLTDMVAGTSTGALISAAIIAEHSPGIPRFSPADLLGLYAHRGPQIFSKNRPVNSSPLKIVLESSFGEMTLSDLKKHFLFVSYDELGQEPFVFSDRMSKYRDVRLSKALLASSAVRPYFNPVEINGKLLSDGVVTAKNPAALAYHFAKAYFPDDLIVLLSFGTGALPESAQDSIEHKVLETHLHLLDESLNNWQLMYYRFEPGLYGASIDMDDTSESNIRALISAGDRYLDNNHPMIDAVISKLMRLKGQL